MIKARTDFLDTGAYLPLAKHVGGQLAKLFEDKKDINIIDAGCGEGYYTCEYAKAMPGAYLYGVDISKAGIDHAASRARGSVPKLSNVSFIVGSAFKLPFKDSIADAVVSTFAPVSNDEYARVLKKGGHLLIISPAKKHLLSLKSILYDKPYENETNTYALNKFELISMHTLEYTAHISGNDKLKALFTMTPYYYKTSKQASARLDDVNELDVECAFEIRDYTLL